MTAGLPATSQKGSDRHTEVWKNNINLTTMFNRLPWQWQSRTK